MADLAFEKHLLAKCGILGAGGAGRTREHQACENVNPEICHGPTVVMSGNGELALRLPDNFVRIAYRGQV
jgi:hypothetical protein